MRRSGPDRPEWLLFSAWFWQAMPVRPETKITVLPSGETLGRSSVPSPSASTVVWPALSTTPIKSGSFTAISSPRTS